MVEANTVERVEKCQRTLDLMGLDQVTNLRTDGISDTVERSIEDSTKRLDGKMGVSA